MKKFALVLVGIVVFVTFIGQAISHAKIIGKTVKYNVAGTVMKGYLAYIHGFATRRRFAAG